MHVYDTKIVCKPASSNIEVSRMLTSCFLYKAILACYLSFPCRCCYACHWFYEICLVQSIPGLLLPPVEAGMRSQKYDDPETGTSDCRHADKDGVITGPCYPGPYKDRWSPVCPQPYMIT